MLDYQFRNSDQIPTAPFPSPTPAVSVQRSQISHGQCVAGAPAAVAAADYVIGQITLPAGGPWNIYKVWALSGLATATAGEVGGGYFLFRSASGDVFPNPSPSRFPAGLISDFLGALNPSVTNPLQIFDVNWAAAGKAVIDCIFHIPFAVTAAPQVVIGMIYGPSRALTRPAVWSDIARIQTAAAADTAVGTITLAESARRITGICAVAAQGSVITAGEELLGFIRLSSDDLNLAPAQFPLSAAYSAGLGVTISTSAVPQSQFIPVDIPVPGGSRINCYIDLSTAVTNDAEIEVFVSYE